MVNFLFFFFEDLNLEAVLVANDTDLSRAAGLGLGSACAAVSRRGWRWRGAQRGASSPRWG